MSAATQPCGNVAAEATSFVDRDSDIGEVRRLMSGARLVTLTGVGGVGKSRLAVHLAGQLRGDFRDGVWLVDLAQVRDSSLIPHTIVQTLGIHDGTGRDLLDLLGDTLRDRRMLLILDNCEHLIDDCAAAVDTLLRQAGELRILATTREALQVVGEHVHPVLPLSVPDPGSAGPIELREGKGQYAAITLFQQRATEAGSASALAEHDVAMVADVCRRLEGLPLALELAAARLPDLPLPVLREQLDDVVRGSAVRYPGARHTSLTAAVDWSYQLCSAGEQAVWARASVFEGNFGIEAAEHVCVGDDLPAGEVAEVLAALVEKSIMLREEHRGRMRYRMLDTIRTFGREKLRGAGAEKTYRSRHRDHYLAVAAEGERDWYGPRQAEIFTRTRLEHANLRAALDYCLASPEEYPAGLRLAGTLWFYWAGCGMLTEGRYWLDLALASTMEPSQDRAKALWVDGYVATLQGDVAGAVALLEECRTYADQTGNAVALAYSTHRLACNALLGDDVEHAKALFEHAQEQYRRLGEQNSNVMLAGIELAIASVFLGDLNRAAALCDEAREIGGAVGEKWASAYAIYVQALVALSRGDFAQATEHGRTCLRIKRPFNDLLGMVLAVEVLAWTEAAQGRWEAAATMLGSARRIWQSVGYPMFGSRYFGAPHGECESQTRRALGDRQFDSTFRSGMALSLDDAVAYALGEQGLRAGERVG